MAIDPPLYGPDGDMLPGPWGDYGLGYFDRQGQRLTMAEYSALRMFDTYRRIAEDRIADLLISTVWLGMDHGFVRGGPPVIFETMIFDIEPDGPAMRGDPKLALLQSPSMRELVGQTWRYCTEVEAFAGHEAACAAVKLRLETPRDEYA